MIKQTNYLLRFGYTYYNNSDQVVSFVNYVHYSINYGGLIGELWSSYNSRNYSQYLKGLELSKAIHVDLNIRDHF